jgi:hypothetical protein
VRGTTLGSVLVGLVVVGGVAAGDPWEEQCREQLEVAGLALSAQGYEMTHEPYLGDLAEGDSDLLGVTLDKGREYALVGVCDEDCRDLDMRVLSLSGEEIDSDVEVDDYPMVEVTVTGSGGFRLEVIMATCQDGPCAYGIGVFAK